MDVVVVESCAWAMRLGRVNDPYEVWPKVGNGRWSMKLGRRGRHP